MPGPLSAKTPKCLRENWLQGLVLRRAEAASGPERPLFCEAHLSWPTTSCLVHTSLSMEQAGLGCGWEKKKKNRNHHPILKCRLSHKLVWACRFRAVCKAKTHLAWLWVASPHSCAHTHPEEARAEAWPSSTPSYPDSWQWPSLCLHNLSPGHCSILLFGAGWLLEVRSGMQMWK